MKSSICILLHKLNLFKKKLDTRTYKWFKNLSNETLKDIAYPKNFIVILDNDNNFYIQDMLIKALKNSHQKVIYNKTIEDDLTHFILKKSSILSYIIEADALILSVNINSLKKLKLKPTKYILINDINRNYQYKTLDEETQVESILNTLKPHNKLILNIDNPYVNYIKIKHPGESIGYGLKINSLTNNTPNIRCPFCDKLINYKEVYFNILGNYICKNKDFEIGIKSFEIDTINLKDHTIKLDNNTYPLNTNYLYDVYFIEAFYVLANKLNINKELIYKSILEFSNMPKKMEKYDKKLYLYNVQNADIIDYQKKIDYLKEKNEPVLIGFKNILDNSNLTDISWLYEIDFSGLNKIYIVYDETDLIKTRLSLDNINYKIFNSFDNIKSNNINILMNKKDIKTLLKEHK